MRRKLCLLLLSAAACLVFAGRAAACMCSGPGSACAAVGTADAVFVGMVTGAARQPPSADGAPVRSWGRRGFRFSVAQSFVGVGGTLVEVWTGAGDADCGYGFRRGETYLVYARRDGDRLFTSICTRTRPVGEAAEDLEFLRGLSADESVQISGEVARVRMRLVGGPTDSRAGLAGALVTVEGEGVQRELRADERGRFSLGGLRPGVYIVTLKLPDELWAQPSSHRVEVKARGCANASFIVADNGRVGGAVTDAEGRPASGVLVALYDAEEAKPDGQKSRLTQADAQGRYLFGGLPPGRYRLAVNLWPHPDPGHPSAAFPRNFYPGTDDPAQAEVINVGAGEKVSGRDWRLPSRRAPAEVTIEVVWADGRPVRHAHVNYRDVTYHDPVTNIAARADSDGRFTLKGFEGQTYIVTARSDGVFVGDPRRDGPMIEVEPVRVTLAAGAAPARVVIRKLR